MNAPQELRRLKQKEKPSASEIKCELSDNSAPFPWLFFLLLRQAVSLTGCGTMYDYMRALHQRFCQEPKLLEVQKELERAGKRTEADNTHIKK